MQAWLNFTANNDNLNELGKKFGMNRIRLNVQAWLNFLNEKPL